VRPSRGHLHPTRIKKRLTARPGLAEMTFVISSGWVFHFRPDDNAASKWSITELQ
jgi:hypothetical protein